MCALIRALATAVNHFFTLLPPLVGERSTDARPAQRTRPY